MTDDAWFGVTPEPVAKFVSPPLPTAIYPSQQMLTPPSKVAQDFAELAHESRTVLIDMFAGAGGNVIAFARSGRWASIIAIEKDPSVMACAYHNARIYGVADKITWVHDDSLAYLAANAASIEASATAVFASPPWGGPGYRGDAIFDLRTMQPYSVHQIHEAVKTMDAALYLPRQSDVRQLARLAPEGTKIEVVQYCMVGASKAMVAYIPATAPLAVAA